jgi:hypothetical protein
MKISTSKIFFAWLFSVVFASQIWGQAITITAADMPAPAEPYTVDVVTSNLPAVTIGNNAAWNYATVYGNSPITADFYPEYVPFFTNAGVDIYRFLLKNMNSDFGYNTYMEFDFNNAAIDDIGVDVPAQEYTLQPFTGNINDSLFIPAQSYLVPAPHRIVEFPMTANSAWSSSSRRYTDMIFNVPAFGLNNAPLRHAYTWVRNDSIVGYGKMRVYTASGPSIDYDVLMDRVEEYTLDSFYLYGSPAPVQLLTVFGATQGQLTEQNYRYNFYRKGSFNYLASFYYADDASFGTPLAFYVTQDGLETATASAVGEKASYATVLYPNPCAGSEINVKVLGNHFDIEKYRITDQMGRLVRQGQTEATGDGVRVRLEAALPTGQYHISLMDRDLRSVVSEIFEVIH